MRFWSRGAAGATFAAALVLLLSLPATAAPPTLSLEGSATVVGGTIHATAELAESPEALGEIEFEVFGPADSTCAATALDESSVAVNGEGEYTSDDFEPAAAGSYFWTARYTGDGVNEPAESKCAATSTVSKATPALTGSAGSGTVGGAIHDEVTLTGGFSPGGEVTFSVFAPGDTSCATPLETTSAPLSGGEASSDDFLTAQAGVFRWTANYAGDANNSAVELGCGSANQASTVARASPGLSGTATSSAVVGSTITDQVTLSAGFSPGGQIVFRAFGPGDSSCSGSIAYEATVSVSGNGSYSPAGFSPGPGVYRWTAGYAGDTNNETAGLGCNASGQSSTVTKATPALTGSAGSATVGGSIHDVVTVSGGFSPGGEVTFSVFAPGDTGCATPLETTSAPISAGKATSDDFPTPQAGEFRWTASYAGDANNETVELGCNSANQSSAVAKASPGLTGTATSSAVVGSTITDQVTLSAGFSPGGQIVFRAFGPGDSTCGSTPAYEATVPVSGNGSYSPTGFAPGTGLYRWTAKYEGDGNNQSVGLGCNASGQSSAVGMIDPGLSAGASGGTVGTQVTASATLSEGATPAGEIVFKVFQTGDANCSGAAMFSSTVKVSGNGVYRSDAFLPARVGAYRWTVAYSGDAHHTPASVGCGQATSTIVQAKPSIAGTAPQRVVVGTAFQDIATLKGGFAPNGTVTFRIYGPVAGGCSGPAFINTIAVKNNGTVGSDPFVPLQAGRYSFAVSYSGDSDNQSASEPCDSPSQVVQVMKRSPLVKPRAALVGGRRISIRARLSGALSPTGSITFKLYGPNDNRCRRKPKFSGKVAVKANGTIPLARYLATKAGAYRLSVAYSGDKRNLGYKGTCSTAQSIRIK